MVEVIGFEADRTGCPCAVFLSTEYTSGKHKPYQVMDRALRVDGGWYPCGNVPGPRWFSEAEPWIEREYQRAMTCGLGRFVS